MSTPSPHNRLITHAARAVLRPIGLTQKGRSRVWLDDHGWWLGVVEFQPSAWSRGAYLNVGVMWLWRETGDHDIYFDLGHRIDDAGFIEYQSDDQFSADARRKAMWDAAVALGLSGRHTDAARMFRQLAEDDDDDGDWWRAVMQRADEMSALVIDDPDRFRAEVTRWVARYRDALNLGPLSSSLP